jgi:hypothetical protein
MTKHYELIAEPHRGMVMSDMVTIPLPKGCILVIPRYQYDEGVKRGKAYRRRQTLEKRLAKLRAEHKAAKPAAPDDISYDTHNTRS